MGLLFSYSLAVSIVLIPLYLTIRLCLAGQTFHRLTRAVMLASLAASLILPFVAEAAGGVWSALFSPAGQSVGVITTGLPMAVAVADIPAELSTPLWLRAMIVIYTLGVAFFLFREGWGVARLLAVIRNSRPAGTAGRWRVRVHDLPGAGAFSFGRYIIIPEDDSDSLPEAVVTHESAHLAARHWADLLFVDLVAILCWYCPAAWLMRRDLSATHEYEADEAVIASGVCAADYQIMLIKKAAGSRFPSIACNLTFKSTITKRVKMMLKPKSRPALRLLAAAALPVVGLSLLALSAPAVANALSTVSDAKITNNSADVQMSETPDEPIIVTGVATYAKDSVGNTYLKLGEAKLPEETVRVHTSEATAIAAGEPAPLVIIDGQEADEATVGMLKPENIESVTVLRDQDAVKQYADNPRAKDGVVIVKTKKAAEPAAAPVAKDDDAVFEGEPEVYPQFEGGDAGLFNFLIKNIKFPKEIQGPELKSRVITRFVINTDGSVCDPEIVRHGKYPCLDEEALRVVKLLRFKSPAMQDGKPVRCRYVLPITFSFSDDKDETTPAEAK